MDANTLGPYKNLVVWQKAIEFTTELYKVTKKYPHDEIFGLFSQMRRAAVSISSNIAEGYGRSTNADLIHFLYIALGSSNEVESQIYVSYNLEYISDDEFKMLNDMNSEINARLRALIKTRCQY